MGNGINDALAHLREALLAQLGLNLQAAVLTFTDEQQLRLPVPSAESGSTLQHPSPSLPVASALGNLRVAVKEHLGLEASATMLIFPENQELRLPVPATTDTPAVPGVVTPAPWRLRRIHRKVLEVAPVGLSHAMHMKKLAGLCGYSYTPFFRDAVHDLEDMGLLQRTHRGVFRP